MTHSEFISNIAKYVTKYAPEFGVAVCSPIIAQAILESGWGTSTKAQHHNYFGLKYRKGRVDCHNGTFVDGGSEQNADGSYVAITDQWYSFADMEMGVKGYFQFTNISNYANLKGVTDPLTYLQNIKADGYATSLTYVDNVYRVITENNLTQYDTGSEETTMNIIESIMTKNPCYTAGKKITVKGLMLHSVGCSQPSAMAFINNWNSASYDRACVHGFIDANTGAIYQTLPWNHRGWHGGGSSNNTHIGVEMCEPDCIKYTGGSSFTCSDKAKAVTMVKRTYNSAVELFAYLCKEYGLNPLKDICSHREGCAMGIASNHGDPEHLWNGLGLSYTMDTFRADVKAKMNGSTEKPTTSTATTTTNEVASFPDVPFAVKVIIDDLNYRSLPSMSGTVNGQTGKGVFTIIEVNNGWGRLKSGAGWIYIGNPEYCTILGSTSTQIAQSTKKSVAEIAAEVLHGDWGNGSDRKSALEKAGYNYSEVQQAVNNLVNGTSTPVKAVDYTAIAKAVIRGDYGNGADRKARLEAAGYDYAKVQAKVNELCS